MLMGAVYWWTRQIVFIFAGCFFLLFGIYLLIAAYQLDNPAYFIMTFFAASLIILISAALLVGFVLQVRSACKDQSRLQ
jgi:hypothetical protein